MRRKTFRLFVSSTFLDFVNERSIINERLSTRLESYCERYGYGFEVVDLRWGIGEIASENQLTLDICLNEIARCKLYAPRPHFLLMLGGRYGSIPLPTELAPNAYETIVSTLEAEESSLVRHWYEFDDNCLGGTYRLKPRKGRFRDYSDWSGVKRGLLTAIGSAIDANPAMASDGLTLASMTEHEFNAALLKHDMCEGSVVVLREGGENEEKAHELRKRAAELMNSKGLADRVVELRQGEPGYEQSFEDEVFRLLTQLVDSEVRASARDDADTILPSRETSRVFVGREHEIGLLREYASSSSRSVLWVHGPSGSGKTSLLQRFVDEYPHRKAFVSYGRSEDTFTMGGAVREIRRQLADGNGAEVVPYVDGSNLPEALLSELSAKANEHAPLLVVIDGLESLMNNGDVNENVLPSTLPAGAKLVVSWAHEDARPFALPFAGQELVLGALSDEEALLAVDARLALGGRRVAPDNQREAIRDSFRVAATPLQATLISNIVSRWSSGFRDTELPLTPREAALAYIDGAFLLLGHGRELVLHSMALVCVAPFGISEREILDVLQSIGGVREEFLGQDRYGHSGDKLPFVVWSRLYYDLRECLETVLFKGVPVVRFVHSIFKDAVHSAHEPYCKRAVEALLRYYSSRPAHVDAPWTAPDTMRAANLPALLGTAGRDDELAELLCASEELDAVLQIGDYERALDALARLGGRPDGLLREDVVAMSWYLRAHRGTLSCFPRSLPAAMSHELGVDRRSRLGRGANGLADSSGSLIPVPHPPNSGIALSLDGDEIAIWHGPWVYVYGPGLTANCRIYNTADSGAGLVITSLCWLAGSELAVGLSDGRIVTYDVHVPPPSLVVSVALESPEYLSYSSCLDVVVASTKSSLVAIDAHRTDVRLLAELREESSWCMSADGLAVHVRDRRSVRSIAIVDGTTITERRVHADGHLVGELPDGRLLLDGYSIIDAHGTAVYFKVPRQAEIVSSLLSRDVLACTYPDGVFVIRPAVETAGHWISVPHTGTSSLSATGDTLAALSDYGLAIRSTAHETMEKLRAIPVFVSRRPIDYERGMLSLLPRLVASFVRMDIALHTARSWANLRLNALGEAVKRWGIGALRDGGAVPGIGRATLVVQSVAGWTAVAYEFSDTVALYDLGWSERMRVDRLRFSAFDPLLGMDLSADGGLLLICRPSSVTVYRTHDASRALEINLTGGTLVSAALEEGGIVELYGLSGTTRRFQVGNRPKRCEVVDWPTYPRDDVAATVLYPTASGAECVVVKARKGITTTTYDTSYYCGKNHSLLYCDGAFFLDGDKSKPFLSSEYDFGQCLREERQKEPDDLIRFIREKNDLTSSLYDLDERFLLLVCKRLSSVILFDIDSLSVADAYRTQDEIIGSRFDADASEVLLFSNSSPHISRLRLTI
ncbi:MAG: AAA family ATPase [Coriobacteriales bacterium]|nr:AAA family ATPase [Coriobacteriales bacterium]